MIIPTYKQQKKSQVDLLVPMVIDDYLKDNVSLRSINAYLYVGFPKERGVVMTYNNYHQIIKKLEAAGIVNINDLEEEYQKVTNKVSGLSRRLRELVETYYIHLQNMFMMSRTLYEPLPEEYKKELIEKQDNYFNPYYGKSESESS